jgi:hypothetical protein
MASPHAGTLAAPRIGRDTHADSIPAVARAGLWTLIVGHLIATWGTQWDVLWHLTIGRDSFWIAPHVMTYSGVSIIVLASFGVLAWMTVRGAPGAIRVFGVSGTAGYQLAAWGILLTVVAAPIDDLWHRLFGLDVTLWSPPHLLGLLGGVVNACACCLIAEETYPPRSAARLTALMLAGAILCGALTFALQPGFRTAYVYGGLRFFTYPILAALLVSLPLVALSRRSRLRMAPVLLLLGVLALGLAGAGIARLGFAYTRPTSFLAEEIAKDPTSPIAVTHEIARKNGTAPRAGNPMVAVLSLVAALAMAVVDPRRRPALAALAFGTTLFVGVGALLVRLPAFAQSLPSLPDVALALALTVLAALAAGTLAGRSQGS